MFCAPHGTRGSRGTIAPPLMKSRRRTASPLVIPDRDDSAGTGGRPAMRGRSLKSPRLRARYVANCIDTGRNMTAQSLGYLGVRAKDLGDWGAYGSGMWGLQRIDKSARSMAFRLDDRQQRIIVDADGGEGRGFFGWEVADAAALEAIAARLERAGVPVARGSRTLADERRVKDLIVTNDPVGNRLELFHGAETTAYPFRPGRSISGF